ncbi:hypothetical protein ADL33_18145 [Streptomyces sp. NRRL WC-3604]|nr:hypothetical protein ADL33_18145 [Streptomyces sp. NRRL WC-3604]
MITSPPLSGESSSSNPQSDRFSGSVEHPAALMTRSMTSSHVSPVASTNTAPPRASLSRSSVSVRPDPGGPVTSATL